MPKQKKNLGLAIAGLILNILVLPGLGTLIAGKKSTGIAQIVIWVCGFLLTLTLIGAILGIPMMIGAWIWGIVSGVNLVKEAG